MTTNTTPQERHTADEEAKPKAVPRLWGTRPTDDELKEFVFAWCNGQLFSDRHIQNPNDLPMVFLPVALGAFAETPKEDLEQIGVMYEFLSAAGPTSCNGMPCFFSMRLLHKQDWERCRVAIEAELERRKNVTI